MKKTNRKLIPAVAMLLVSAIMLSTASFAWFSMNDTVHANNMKVTAKTESGFLLISGDKTTATEIQKQNQTTVDFNMAASAAEILPSKHGDVTNNGATITWQYAFSNDPSKTKGSGQELSYQTISAESLGNYALKKTVYVTVAKNSAEMEELKVKDIAINGLAPSEEGAVKVLVVGETGNQEFDKSTNPNNSATILDSGKITDATVSQVDIYIFYDGEHEKVYTNNLAKLQNVSVNVSFEAHESAEAKD